MCRARARTYVASVALSSTQGLGVKVDPARVRITDEELAEATA